MDVVDTDLLLGVVTGSDFDVALSVNVVTTIELELDASACMSKENKLKNYLQNLLIPSVDGLVNISLHLSVRVDICRS